MIRAGVLSAGSWSEGSHLPALQARPDVELAVVSRPDAEQAKRVAEKFSVPRYETDWRVALDAGLDAVVVSSPPAAHEAQVVAALESGAHVLCEKPFALTAASARRMVDAARASGRQLLVGFGWTATPVFRHAHDLITAGEIGELEHVMMHLAVNTRALLGGSTDGGWAGAGESEVATYTDPAISGGGAAAVSMSHEFGMLLWLVQQPILQVAGLTFPSGASIDLHDAVVVEFAGGGSGAVSCASTHPHNEQPQWHVAIYGDNGEIWLDSTIGTIRLVRADGSVWELPPCQGNGAYDPGAPTNELIDAAAGRRPCDGYTGALAARVVEITEALYASSNSGGSPVTVDRRTELT